MIITLEPKGSQPRISQLIFAKNIGRSATGGYWPRISQDQFGFSLEYQSISWVLAQNIKESAGFWSRKLGNFLGKSRNSQDQLGFGLEYMYRDRKSVV